LLRCEHLGPTLVPCTSYDVPGLIPTIGCEVVRRCTANAVAGRAGVSEPETFTASCCVQPIPLYPTPCLEMGRNIYIVICCFRSTSPIRHRLTDCLSTQTSSTRRRSSSCSLSNRAHLCWSNGRRRTTAGVAPSGLGRLPARSCFTSPPSAPAGTAAAGAIMLLDLPCASPTATGCCCFHELQDDHPGYKMSRHLGLPPLYRLSLISLLVLFCSPLRTKTTRVKYF